MAKLDKGHAVIENPENRPMHEALKALATSFTANCIILVMLQISAMAQ
jgi:hypothetical protein